jgi:hypothetical protein
MILLGILFIYGYPLLSNEIVKTEINFDKVNYGIDGITNSSNTNNNVPLGKLYHQVTKMFGIKMGIDVSLIDVEKVFDSLTVKLLTLNDTLISDEQIKSKKFVWESY